MHAKLLFLAVVTVACHVAVQPGFSNTPSSVEGRPSRRANDVVANAKEGCSERNADSPRPESPNCLEPTQPIAPADPSEPLRPVANPTLIEHRSEQ